MSTPITIGIVGFGHLGQYLYQHLALNPQFASRAKITWIWNRSTEKITTTPIQVLVGDKKDESVTVPPELVLKDMKADLPGRKVDVILEVCHPAVLAESIDLWLANCRAVYVGSPTGFSVQAVLDKTLAAAAANKAQVFVPTGALWGVQDIAKMGARRSISALHITMKKPAASTRLNQPLQEKVDEFLEKERAAKAAGTEEALAALPKSVVIFDGPVGELCPLAPNNVNTMACAALASGPEVGFGGCRGTFVIERDSDVHIIEVEITGKTQPGFDKPLVVRSSRVNPCAVGAVTGQATYVSFFSSLIGVIETLEKEVAAVSTASALRFC